jgi:hypothetical protein
MKFRQALTSCILTSTLAVSQSLFLYGQNQVKAQPSRARPYIVLVNGYQNCCAWGITDRFPSMNAEIRSVPYSNFSNGGSSGNTSDDSAFLQEGADFINNQLDINRPLILIGHSFGGDSVLKLLPRINRRIQFVAVIDPVRTGGFRSSLVSLRAPSNIDYFFNRWQENLPFPNDFKTNGSISCVAKQCDQDSQNIARNADFSPVTTECRWDEITCPGFVAPNPFIGRPGRKGRKQVRVSHQDLPRDAFLQTDLGNKIQKQLSAFRVSYSNPDVFNADYYLNSYPDLRQAFGTNRVEAEKHWLNRGILEGRQGSTQFSTKCYINRYPDLKAAFGDDYTKALKHFIDRGRDFENRNGSC